MTNPPRRLTDRTEPWLLLAAVGVVIFFAGVLADSRILHWIGKPIPVTMLIPAVLIWSRRAEGSAPPAARYRNSLVAGLAFSVAGDVFLMLPGDWFLHGLVAFLIGHVCYIVAFTSPGESGPDGIRPRAGLRPLRLLPYLIYAIPCFVILWPHLGEMRIAVVVYMAVILTMGWRSAARLGLAGELRAAQIAGVLGAASFIVSDTIIAMNRFHAPVPAERWLIMLTYWGGQLGIACSARRFATRT